MRALWIFLWLLGLMACGKKKTIDALNKEVNRSDLSYYKNKDTLYSPASTSPHGDFKLKLNPRACDALGSDGRLPVSLSFPEGAVLIKEVYKDGRIDRYAVMKKDPGSRFASHKWIWAELRLDGSSIYDVSKRGEACTACHSNVPNRDMVQSFDLH
jgi:hypothetical protein